MAIHFLLWPLGWGEIEAQELAKDAWAHSTLGEAIEALESVVDIGERAGNVVVLAGQ